jgi:hypothetical protein
MEWGPGAASSKGLLKLLPTPHVLPATSLRKSDGGSASGGDDGFLRLGEGREDWRCDAKSWWSRATASASGYSRSSSSSGSRSSTSGSGSVMCWGDGCLRGRHHCMLRRAAIGLGLA